MSQATQTLRSQQDTARVRALVMLAARARFADGLQFTPTYEHGRWWLIIEDGRPNADRVYSNWSVVDAVPGIDGTGLDFEEI